MSAAFTLTLILHLPQAACVSIRGVVSESDEVDAAKMNTHVHRLDGVHWDA